MCSTRTRRKKIDFTKVLEEGQNEDDFEEEDEDYIPPQDKTMWFIFVEIDFSILNH